MKALIDFVKEITHIPAKAIGWVVIFLLVCTQLPQLNFIPKGIILYILTPFVMGSR